MANGSQGVSQAQALNEILARQYLPMMLPTQQVAADGSWSWHCAAMKQAALYAVTVDREGGVSGTPLGN